MSFKVKRVEIDKEDGLTTIILNPKSFHPPNVIENAIIKKDGKSWLIRGTNSYKFVIRQDDNYDDIIDLIDPSEIKIIKKKKWFSDEIKEIVDIDQGWIRFKKSKNVSLRVEGNIIFKTVS